MLVCGFGCSVTSRLKHRNISATMEYIPINNIAKQSNALESDMKLSRSDSITDHVTSILVPSITDEYGDQIMNLTIGEVVVKAKSRTLPERRGKILIDFMVKFPKELQGSCQSITITPWLHKLDASVALSELVLRGRLFSRIQDRNYWQHQRYVDIFDPDSISLQTKYRRFIKYPYSDGVRLDSIVDGQQDITYFYSQEVSTVGEGRKLRVTLNGVVKALDGSMYVFPESDTLEYNISSMLSFVDTTARYMTQIVEKYAVVDNTNYLSFKVNDVSINDSLEDNLNQLRDIECLMEKIMNQDEFHIDNISLTASASPEGNFYKNDALAMGRAQALKRRLSERFGRSVDTLITVNWIAEDWDRLVKLIECDSNIMNKESILRIIDNVESPDERELRIKRGFLVDYDYIKNNIYPKLRSVNFKYNLRRTGMVKDTIHTTTLDTVYAQGIRLLNDRRYSESLMILNEYKDYNCALALMSLGYDERAGEILSGLPLTANTAYLQAIIFSRMGHKQIGCEYFMKACVLDDRMEYRGKLDPEISELFKK